jgi:hypothetical protein
MNDRKNNLDIILHPQKSTTKFSLRDLYDRAISEAIELFIVSAYLTDWKPKKSISKKCEELSFIVGTDFGLTRKDACKAVLTWLPKEMKNDFLAADSLSGFHPKFVMWKTSNKYNIVLGSSNLTQAAFTTNFEANIFSKISKQQYDVIKEWVYSIRLQSTPISQDWLDCYQESDKSKRSTSNKKQPVISLILPSGRDISAAVKRRKSQQKAFSNIKNKLKVLINKCAQGKISNARFYQEMMSLWGKHSSRFQGRGFEIRGKHSDWKATCKSLSKIIAKSDSYSELALDSLVRKEIDHLAEVQNPNRKAWLSEMLCHFFPEKYPIINDPVEAWLSHNKYRGPHNASDGARYIDLSIKLREALANNKKHSALNLAELDHAIWRWNIRNN